MKIRGESVDNCPKPHFRPFEEGNFNKDLGGVVKCSKSNPLKTGVFSVISKKIHICEKKGLRVSGTNPKHPLTEGKQTTTLRTNGNKDWTETALAARH